MFASFCPSPRHPNKIALQTLDVVRAITVYLTAMSLLQRTYLSEFVGIKGQAPPFLVAVHSARAVRAS